MYRYDLRANLRILAMDPVGYKVHGRKVNRRWQFSCVENAHGNVYSSSSFEWICPFIWCWASGCYVWSTFGSSYVSVQSDDISNFIWPDEIFNGEQELSRIYGNQLWCVLCKNSRLDGVGVPILGWIAEWFFFWDYQSEFTSVWHAYYFCVLVHAMSTT